jgi:hypothetical protein
MVHQPGPLADLTGWSVGRLLHGLLVQPISSPELILGRLSQFGSHLARLGVRAERAAEEQDVRLGAVRRVVHPAAALLHAKVAPLGVREQAVRGHVLGELLREDHVTVLVLVIAVLVTVLASVGHCRAINSSVLGFFFRAVVSGFWFHVAPMNFIAISIGSG